VTSLEDIRTLEKDIAALRAALRPKDQLPADARVTALSALVHAEAVVLAVKAYGDPVRGGVVRDVVKPLTGAMDEFRGSVVKLTAALRRLPDS
jgi:hypothetical protein